MARFNDFSYLKHLWVKVRPEGAGFPAISDKIDGIFARVASLNFQDEQILANDFGAWLSTLHGISIEDFGKDVPILHTATYDSEAFEQDLEINLNLLQSFLSDILSRLKSKASCS